MKNKLTEIFQKSTYSPEPGLAETISGVINTRNKKAAQIKIWVFGFAGFISLLGLVPTFKILLADLTRSGFYEYFSLLFSDTGSIISYWKEFTFSIAESLPIISIISVLSLLFVCFLSLKYLIKQINKNQLISSLMLS